MLDKIHVKSLFLCHWIRTQNTGYHKMLVYPVVSPPGRRGGDNRGWEGWMASLTQWTWVWASSGSWWWTGKPGVLQSMGSQRVGQDWATELNWSCFLVAKSYLTLLWPHRLKSIRLLCPWDSPGKNTGVGFHFLLQGIFLTQESNPNLLHRQADSLPLSQQIPQKVT